MPRGVNAEFVPEFLALLGESPQKAEAFLAAAEVLQHRVGEVAGDVVDRAVLGLDTPFGRQRQQLVFAADLVAGGVARRQGGEHLEDVTTVVRVCRGPRGDGPAEVARDDDVRVGAADAFLRPLAERVDAARAHRAVAAADAHRAIAALRLLGGEAIPYGLDAFLAGPRQHLAGVVIDTEFAQVVGSLHVKSPR